MATVSEWNNAAARPDVFNTKNRARRHAIGLLLIRRWFLASIILLVLSLLIPTNASAQGFGPRAFQLVPENTNVLALYGYLLDGNRAVDPSVVIQGADIDIDLAVLQYSRAFAIKGNQAGIYGIVSAGQVDGAVDLGGMALSDSNSGFGDIQIGATFGVIGSPSLSLEEYVKFKPAFSAGILTLFTLPTGQYDESHALNLGTNRWAAQLGTVLLWYQGDTLLDPRLRTFELVPSFTFYGDNDDPFGANSTEQSAMFKLEGHITQNINQAMFLSADAFYTYGGETTTDGVNNNDKQSA
ncbi:MAG: transporter [Xanthomonadales bacterium]|nr:transporter [Xanthomonadales bacterium]